MDSDVERRIAQAFKAFGSMRRALFMDKDLSIRTKRKIYQACVISVLLYGSECWTLLRRHKRKLDSFHHRCVRTILGISNRQQWAQRITSQEVRRRWGDPATATKKVTARRLEWLGHLARMPSNRIAKKCLFGWLPQPRPRGGPRKRWRDMVRTDLREANVSEDEWYDLATTSRRVWRATYHEALQEKVTNERQRGLPQTSPNQVLCQECGRCFRREGDKKRHKCSSERRKPVSEQRGAVQCEFCHRWFRSRGGHSVHTCRPRPP